MCAPCQSVALAMSPIFSGYSAHLKDDLKTGALWRLQSLYLLAVLRAKAQKAESSIKKARCS